MKERIKELGYWIEDSLREFCGEITPDKRLTIILIILLLGTIANLYLTFHTIHEWGKESERKEQLKIEHIKQLEFQKKNNYDYLYEETEDSTDNPQNESE